MKSGENKGGDQLHHAHWADQAEAAGLAAKVAALPHLPRPRHGWLWRTFYVGFWLATSALLIAALLRVVYHDGTHLLTWINAFTTYVYLPAYLCAAWALWMHRWALLAVSTIVIGFHLIWIAPDFMRDSRFDMASTTEASNANESPTVRIFFANVLASNHDFEPLWKEIAASDADVVVLVECSRFSKRSFRESPLMAKYSHVNGKMRVQSGEVTIYSTLPITAESQVLVANRMLRTVDVKVGDGSLRIVGLHAPRPMNRPEYDYFGYWDRVVPMLAAEKRPQVVVGDYNATQHSHVYEQLQAANMRSAHDDRGRGYATTWPRSRWWLPPIRIDQALLSPDVECLQVREGKGEGSDHRPVIVDVRLRRTAAETE